MPLSTLDPFRQRGESYSAANRAKPDARALERDRLFAHISIRPGACVVDLQAAGGYVGEGVFDRYGEKVIVVGIEPSPTLVRTLPRRQSPLNASLEQLPLRSASVDVVLCLAGTHHSSDLQRIFAECHRILRPGGQISVCEVEEGSAMAKWLNGFVDQWCRDGHKGRFVRAGELKERLVAAGFREVAEERAQVPWQFADEREMVSFCRTLFGLSAVAREVVERGIHEHLEITQDESSMQLAWALCYASGRRPARPQVSDRG